RPRTPPFGARKREGAVGRIPVDPPSIGTIRRKIDAMPEPGIHQLLHHGGEPLLDEILAGRGLGRTAARLALAMTLGAALYGAVFGSWHGARLALYVAIKFPL